MIYRIRFDDIFCCVVGDKRFDKLRLWNIVDDSKQNKRKKFVLKKFFILPSLFGNVGHARISSPRIKYSNDWLLSLGDAARLFVCSFESSIQIK
jgi:hypothetical protein